MLCCLAHSKALQLLQVDRQRQEVLQEEFSYRGEEELVVMAEGATTTRPAVSKAFVKEALKEILEEPYLGEVGLEAAARALRTGLRGELGFIT